MCLERAFSGYLAYFFEVGLRGDTKGPKRGKEGEGLSPVDIELKLRPFFSSICGT